MENIFAREEAVKLLYYLLTMPSSVTFQFAKAIEGGGKAGKMLCNTGLDDLAAKCNGCGEIAALLKELAEKKKRNEELEKLGLKHNGKKRNKPNKAKKA